MVFGITHPDRALVTLYGFVAAFIADINGHNQMKQLQLIRLSQLQSTLNFTRMISIMLFLTKKPLLNN